MKKLLAIATLLFATSTVSAQEKVGELPIGNNGQFLFIPGFLTKDGQAVMYIQSEDWENKVTKFTIFDENMNVAKTFSVPYQQLQYQQKSVYANRYMNADHTAFTSEWEESVGEVQDYNESSSSAAGFQLFTESNPFSNQPLYLTQTLFDEDEEFEYLRPVYEVIPITTKEKDYITAHSTPEESGGTGGDEWWRQYGADGAYYEDPYYGSEYWCLYKNDNYGGKFLSGYEVVSVDGVVKKTIKSVKGNMYYYRGNVYYFGGSKSNIIYKLNSHKLPEATTYGPSYDLNRDGKVNAADHVTLTNKIMEQE